MGIHLSRNLLAVFTSQEPDRYAALSAAGFPVLDSRRPDPVPMHNLLERGGGHYYIDVGGTRLLAEGKAGVEPIAYTATGLRFSDGTTADTDAVVWCVHGVR